MNKKSVLSALLVVIFFLSAMPLNANATVKVEAFRESVDFNYDGRDTDSVIIDPFLEECSIDSLSVEDLIELQPGDKTLDELKSLSVDVLSLPEVIDSATAKEKGHVNRLYEQESSLNTLIYQNKDATKTAYIFSKPIKYVDSNGLIRDKSTKISKVSEPNYLYGMTDNSVKVLFPRSANAGIQISYNDYSIIMAPDTSDNDNIVYRQNDNSIEYFGF